MENKLRARIGEESYQKLSKIKNPALFDFIGNILNSATRQRLRFKRFP